MIGVLMLIGIVVTNAIVLMDLINQYREQGMPVGEAVIEGGRHRLRPILMTAVATIFALLPMALGLTGEGGFISQPLAIVVIGGLVSSTLLTLVLVPTLYTMIEGVKERRRLKREGRHAAANPPPAPVSGSGEDGTARAGTGSTRSNRRRRTNRAGRPTGHPSHRGVAGRAQRASSARIARTTSVGASSAMKCPQVTVRCSRSGAQARHSAAASKPSAAPQSCWSTVTGIRSRCPASRSAWSCSTSMPAEAR